eukprot:267683_1
MNATRNIKRVTTLRHISVSHRFYRSNTLINIIDKQEEYPFVKQFLEAIHPNPIHDKWPILRQYQAECKIDSQIDSNKFNLIHQKYVLFPLHDESEHVLQDIVKGNVFLSEMKKMSEGHHLLTPNQFKATKPHLTVWNFRKNVDQILEQLTTVDQRQIPKLSKQLSTSYLCPFFKYKWYGHPYVASIFDRLQEHGTLDPVDVSDLLYYVAELTKYKNECYKNGTYRHFIGVLLFFGGRKNDIRIEDKKYFIHNHARSLRNSMGLKEFWKVQTEKYLNLVDLLNHVAAENEGSTLEECIKYIALLFHEKDDPFFYFLWDRLSAQRYNNKCKKDLKRRVCNRLNIDIATAADSLSIEHCDLLIPLLYRKYEECDMDKIKDLRYKVLIGEDVDKQMVNEIDTVLGSIENGV